MAQDDTQRDDSTQQEFNEDDRVSETLRNQDIDPADVREQDSKNLQEDMEDADDPM
jgi:hypothetical protein